MIARNALSPRRRLLPGRRSLAAMTALLLAAASTVGCGSEAVPADEPGSGPIETPINVRTMQVERMDLSEYVTVTGPLRPVRGTTISTEESGTVASIAIDKGAAVRDGQAIIVLDRELLRAEMRASAANLKLMEYDESRTRQLFDEKQVSRYEMLTLETRLEEARAAADAARIRWDRAAVKAPFGGIVADRFVEPGQLVAPGTPVARVVDPYTLELRASVSEREVGWIREGAAAAIAVDGLDRTLPGRVDWVSFEADPRTGKFQVEVHVENPDMSIRPGVVGRAQILLRTHEDVVVAPRDAIVPQPEGDAVYVVEGERAHIRPVDVGPDQGLLAVIAAGLAPGEFLMVRGQRDVLDGSLIRVTERSTSPDGSIDSDPETIRSGISFTPVHPVVPTEVPPAASIPTETPTEAAAR